MAIPPIHGLTPDDIKKPILIPAGTRVTIKIINEPKILGYNDSEEKFCILEDSEVATHKDRQMLKPYGTVIKAPKASYVDNAVAVEHMVIIPSNYWLIYHTEKDGQEKAADLYTGYKQKYAIWLDQTICQSTDKADTALYTGLELDIIIGLKESDEYGDKNTIKRILD
jgi:hypothetical protein